MPVRSDSIFGNTLKSKHGPGKEPDQQDPISARFSSREVGPDTDWLRSAARDLSRDTSRDARYGITCPGRGSLVTCLAYEVIIWQKFSRARAVVTIQHCS